MQEADLHFMQGDAAEAAGDYAAARIAFEQGATLGDTLCLTRLAYMYDLGLGVRSDKSRAMMLYLRAWRLEPGETAATNIAILHREAGNHRQMFQWFRRAVRAGAHDCYLDLAKCYCDGLGVPKSLPLAIRCLVKVLRADFVFDHTAEEARAMLRCLRHAQFREEPCSDSLARCAHSPASAPT
jgi:uncharacterized protein